MKTAFQPVDRVRVRGLPVSADYARMLADINACSWSASAL
jgi:hypothetical protein